MTDQLMSRRYRVFGLVQGVGFRAFVWREADRLGVRGWVCNRSDGSVEAQAIADREVHEQFHTALERGPSWSRVSRVDADDESELTNNVQGFSIRHDR